MKVCLKCKIEKSESEFNKRKSSKDGLQQNCRKCNKETYKIWQDENKEHKKQYDKIYVQKNKDKINERRKKWYSEHKEEKKLYDKKRREANSTRYKEGKHKHYLKYKEKYLNKHKKYAAEHSEEIRNKNLLKNYGITVEEYEEILKKQNGVCAICKKPPINKRLSVDHHHRLGHVRGLICWTCNRRLLSNLADRENAIELFTNALEYIKRAKEISDKNMTLLEYFKEKESKQEN